jgi:hypothetical protein
MEFKEKRMNFLINLKINYFKKVYFKNIFN